jgi:serine/threonine-protein kinase HipA
VELELVMEVAPYFRVSPARARSVRDEVLGAARRWREVATELGLDRTEQERMARAFRVADASA